MKKQGIENFVLNYPIFVNKMGILIFNIYVYVDVSINFFIIHKKLYWYFVTDKRRMGMRDRRKDLLSLLHKTFCII